MSHVITCDKTLRLQLADIVHLSAYSQCSREPSSKLPVQPKIASHVFISVPLQVEWAHVDIAGPAWDEKAGGATGFGALTLAEWAAKQGSS